MHRSLVLLVSLFGLFLCILAGLAMVGLGIQSGVRAYVGGEGLWSKAEKDAVIDLAVYLNSSDEDAFRRFQRHLRVPLGDRQARETLQTPEVDLSRARRGFLDGHNHPDDVGNMIDLFRRFHWVPEMRHAITTWTRGDLLIEELRTLADRLHAQLSAGPLSPEEREGYRRELESLNERLTSLENEFSGTLSNAARQVHGILIAAIALIAVALAGVGALATQQTALLLSRNEAAVRASERRYRELFERSPAGLYRTRFDGRLLACNSALAQLLGYASSAEVLKLSASDFYLERADRESFLDHLHQKRALVNWEVRLKRSDGTLRWALLNESVIAAEGSDEAVLEGSLIDITARKEAEQLSQHRAYHDPLTELPNRALFKDRLAHALHQGKRRKETVTVIFIDLDHFKQVNDTLGHAAGDEVLIQAAQRLRGSVRAEDTVARFGGDEFMVLLSSDRDWEIGAASVAAKILKVLAEPFRIQGRDLTLSASLGISHYPDDAIDVDTLVANADQALYRAKALGRNNVQYYQALAMAL